MMAGAYTLSQDGHVRGDFISRMLPFKVKASIELACLILFFFPAMLALLYSGSEFFHLSWLQNEHSASSPTGPPIYPFKGIIPLAAIFMLLQGTVETIRCVDRAQDRQDAAAPARRRGAGKGDPGRGGGRQDGRPDPAGRRAPRRKAMTDPQVGILMMCMFIVTIFLGFPIAFTLIALAVFFGYYAMGDNVFQLLVQRAFGVMSNDVLIAVPLFLFMGYMVERSNILDRLFRSLQVSAKHVPASLAVATLATCALFATATGIVGAVVTLMGLLAFPAMLKAGYDIKLSAGVVAAGGCLGILIPPSIMLILYGAMASVSVVRLYAGAFLPGFLLAGLYMVYVIGRAMLNPKLAPKLPKEETDIPMRQMVMLLMTSFFPLAFLILAVLGAILFGLATPNEAAAFGAFGSIVLAIGYGQFSLQRLKEAVFLTARTAAMVCWLFVGSWSFSSVFSYLGGQAVIENFILSLNMTPVTFMLLTQFIIFLLGWPLEWTEIIIIFVPIFLPLLHHFNIDPVFFGVTGGPQHPDVVPDAADGNGVLLPEGRRAEARDAQSDLRRGAAVPVHGLRHRCSWSTSFRRSRCGCRTASTADAELASAGRSRRAWPAVPLHRDRARE